MEFTAVNPADHKCCFDQVTIWDQPESRSQDSSSRNLHNHVKPKEDLVREPIVAELFGGKVVTNCQVRIMRFACSQRLMLTRSAKRSFVARRRQAFHSGTF